MRLEPGSAPSAFPPLAPGLPLVGSLPSVSRLGMLRFLEQQWAALGDVFRLQLGNRSFVIVVHPDGVERILASGRENYVKGPTYDEMGC
jgi:hypothetical protein